MDILSEKLLNQIKAEAFNDTFGTNVDLASIEPRLAELMLEIGANIQIKKCLESIKGESNYMDPFGISKELIRAHFFRNDKYWEKLKDVAIGSTVSCNVNAMAIKGNQGEIAIIFDHGLVVFVVQLYQIILDYFLSNSRKAKNEETKALLKGMAKDYICCKKIANLRNNYSKEIDYLSGSLGMEFLRFCLFHEVGHVVLSHFNEVPAYKDEVNQIRFSQQLELDADKFAYQQWKSNSPVSTDPKNNLKGIDTIYKINPVEIQPIWELFHPLTIQIVCLVFELFDEYVDEDHSTHPLWRTRRKSLPKQHEAQFSTKQEKILETVSILCDLPL